MAIITKLTEKIPARPARHTATEATYFFTAEGNLQIDTYGSNNRQSEKKLSQSTQFSPEIMEQIVEIWKEHKSNL